MLLETASNYYHESGYGDTAGQIMTKAAKSVTNLPPYLPPSLLLYRATIGW